MAVVYFRVLIMHFRGATNKIREKVKPGPLEYDTGMPNTRQ